jgi:hypothetical protein
VYMVFFFLDLYIYCDIAIRMMSLFSNLPVRLLCRKCLQLQSRLLITKASQDLCEEHSVILRGDVEACTK